MGATVWQMNALNHTHDSVTVFPHSAIQLGCFTNCEQNRLRVIVVRTSTQGTIAALKTAARLANELRAEVTLLWAEESPHQCALDDLPVPIETLERQLQKVVYFSGVRETQVLSRIESSNKFFAITVVTSFRLLLLEPDRSGATGTGRCFSSDFSHI